jgi:hypothetical protein
MMRSDKIAQNKGALSSFYHAGLTPSEAYTAFKESGGKWRKQDFLNAYRVYTHEPKAPYNIGRAAPEHVAKFEKKKARKRVSEAKVKVKGAKPRTKARKAKEARHKAARGMPDEIEQTEGEGHYRGAGYEIRSGVDVTAWNKGDVNFSDLVEDLKAHGIRFFDPDGGDTSSLKLAKDSIHGSVHLYGTAIYEEKNDKGGRAVGLSRVLIEKTMKALRASPKKSRKLRRMKSEFQEDLDFD